MTTLALSPDFTPRSESESLMLDGVTPVRPPLSQMTPGTAAYILEQESMVLTLKRLLQDNGNGNGKKGWLDRTMIMMTLAGSIFAAGMSYAKVGELGRTLDAHIAWSQGEGRQADETYVRRKELDAKLDTLNVKIETVQDGLQDIKAALKRGR